ncbi:MAG TPA: hypothetical protein PK014_13130 [Thermoanaerobaculia bacterium]|nr:hypothetical protein [Thermoanaerobaculia bacterium]HUM31043.1 hypothetical protein [Thermoanaerobaculia bacterium]HXK69341.1 hypothetical protein [Thermoanaerobaculia bacterium]
MTYRDSLTYVIPLKSYTVSEVASGHLPLWNPFNGLGEPWMANPQTGVFYPPTYFFLLGDMVGFQLYLLFHLILMAIGTAIWLRGEGRSPVASWLGAALVVSAGPFLTAIDIIFALSTLTYLPWALVFIRKRRAPLLVVTLCLSFLAGEPMVFALMVGTTFIAGLRQGWKWFSLMGVLALMLLILSPQLVQTVSLFLTSDRLAGIDPLIGLRHSIFPREILEIFFGQAWGIATLESVSFAQQTFLVSLYTGIILLPVIFWAMRRRPLRLILPVVLIVLSLGSHSPFLWILTYFFEIFRYPAKFLLFLPLAFAPLLAGFYDDREHVKPVLFWFTVFMALILVPFSSHPARLLLHGAMLGLMAFVMMRVPKLHVALPVILALDLGLASAGVLPLVPIDFQKTLKPLPPLEGSLSYAFVSDVDARGPDYFQREGFYTPEMDRRLVSMGAGYSNLYRRARMLGTSAPMQTKSYGTGKMVLPGVAKFVEIDPVTHRRITKSLHPVHPRVWGEGIEGARIEDESNQAWVTFTARGNSTVHVGITFAPHWKAYMESRPVPILPDTDGFISFLVPPGNHEITLLYQPPTLIPGFLAISGLLFTILWYRRERCRL